MSRRAGAPPRGLARSPGGPQAAREALRSAAELLERRALSASELRGALSGRHGAAEVDSALARLHELGYLDDEAWARRYVESRRAGGLGAKLLSRELRARGIEREVVEAVLSGRDELEAACRAGRARLRAARGSRGGAEGRRLAAFLLRRGFEPDVVARGVRALLGDETPGELDGAAGEWRPGPL